MGIVFFFKHLYWSIIALQWCVSFCCISKWISYTYTYIPVSPPSCVSLPPSLSQTLSFIFLSCRSLTRLRLVWRHQDIRIWDSSILLPPSSIYGFHLMVWNPAASLSSIHQGEARTRVPAPFPWDYILEVCIEYLCSKPVVQNQVTWPLPIAREVGKYSLYFRNPWVRRGELILGNRSFFHTVSVKEC